MYSNLYDAWKKELQDHDLQKLPPDFFVRIVGYLKKLREESRMLDKRTVKADLLRMEMQNVKRMVRELIRTRYHKIVSKGAKAEEVDRDTLTVEEREIYAKSLLCAELVSNLATEIVHGRIPRSGTEQKNQRTAVRLLKDVPAIVGSDMKTFGPFKTEDVASLPAENAKNLIKQGLAQRILVG
jgi:DNA replication factor GINS